MTTLILAEDHPIVRQGIRKLLEAVPDLSIIAETGDGLEALRLVEHLKPDVAVVDLALPGLNGLEVTRQIKKRVPRTQVAIFSMHSNEAYVVEAFRNGAMAYVLKASGIEDLVQAIRDILEGKRFLSPPLRQNQIEAYARADEVIKDLYKTLTPREREVLQLVAEGYTSVQIAEKLFISPRTAETHRSNLMAKLGLHVQADLVRYAMQRGLIPLTRKPRGRQEADR